MEFEVQALRVEIRDTHGAAPKRAADRVAGPPERRRVRTPAERRAQSKRMKEHGEAKRAPAATMAKRAEATKRNPVILTGKSKIAE